MDQRTRGFVYFARRGATGPIKIGFSTHVASRIRSLETGSEEDLVVLATIVGDKGSEHALHVRFRAFKIRREWFAPHVDLLDYIASIGKPRRRVMPPPPGYRPAAQLPIAAVEEAERARVAARAADVLAALGKPVVSPVDLENNRLIAIAQRAAAKPGLL